MDRHIVFFLMLMFWFVLLVWFSWLEHMTSGEFSQKMKGVDVMIAGVCLGFALWLFSGHSDLTYLFLGMFTIFAFVRGGQYFWYAGFLQNVRRRRVERLRAKWQQRLIWLKHYKNAMAKEGRLHSRREVRVMSRSLKQEVVLAWKLEHIVP